MMRKHVLFSLLAGLALLTLPLAAAEPEADAAALLPTPAALADAETTPAAQAVPAPRTQNFNGYEIQVNYLAGGGMCAIDELEVHCSIESDPCGRSFSVWGCCDNDEVGCCEPIISTTAPPCYDGIAVTCN